MFSPGYGRQRSCLFLPSCCSLYFSSDFPERSNSPASEQTMWFLSHSSAAFSNYHNILQNPSIMVPARFIRAFVPLFPVWQAWLLFASWIPLKGTRWRKRNAWSLPAKGVNQMPFGKLKGKLRGLKKNNPVLMNAKTTWLRMCVCPITGILRLTTTQLVTVWSSDRPEKKWPLTIFHS